MREALRRAETTKSDDWDSLLTTREAAQFLRLHPKVLLRKRRRGEMPGVRCYWSGNKLVWRRRDLIAWLEGREI